MEEDKELQETLFGQAHEECPEVMQKAALWSKKMLDPEKCLVCKQPFDLSNRMARIQVQCGHTLCNFCLLPVTRHATSRCPLCLAILMSVGSSDRMPPNPQTFSLLFTREKLDINVQSEDKEDESDTKKLQSPSRQESCEFETCELHHSELKHYFCVDHRNLYCKHCAKIYHTKEKCRVVDVYEIEEDEDFSQLLGEHAK